MTSRINAYKDITYDISILKHLLEELKHDYVVFDLGFKGDCHSVNYRWKPIFDKIELFVVFHISNETVSFSFLDVHEREEYLISDPEFPINIIKRIDELVDAFIKLYKLYPKPNKLSEDYGDEVPF